MAHEIHLSDGRRYIGVLVVRRDWTTSGGGRWRLAWADPTGSGYTDETSSVTGQPYFRTMREARAAGIRRYGERAVRVDW